MYDIIIIGCGLSGMVSARKLADLGYKVLIFEERDHIGGNIYDKIDEDGFLVQKYGPHCFFTNEESIKKYIEDYVEVEDCFVKCRTMIDGKKIPMPFNFASIDLIYDKAEADELKKCLQEEFKEKKIVSVTDLLESKRKIISEYGKYMYDNEYRLYSSKQWGRKIEDISPDVFHRVPVYLSYDDCYQSSKYQFLPKGGFTEFSKRILKSGNIDVILNINPISDGIVYIKENKIVVRWKNNVYDNIPILFTGELDALLGYRYGHLPYRSLEFIWKLIGKNEFQETAIVAYPQADKITRITEYKKMPVQCIEGKTKICIEIPLEYDLQSPVGNEPYYPIKNDKNDSIYNKYLDDAQKIRNLFFCGRLADYKYYNMDAVIMRALDETQKIVEDICNEKNFCGGTDL